MIEHPEVRIRARFAAQTAKAERLRERLRLIEDELHELVTTLKVLERLGLAEEPSDQGILVSPARPGTLADLILKVLNDGPQPIATITERVRTRYGQEIDPNNIRSTAWRMWKAKRLEKTDERYHLLDKEGPAEAGPLGAMGADTGRGRGSEPMIPEGSIPSASTLPFSTGRKESDLF